MDRQLLYLSYLTTQLQYLSEIHNTTHGHSTMIIYDKMY